MAWIKKGEHFITDLKLFKAQWHEYQHPGIDGVFQAVVLDAPETTNVVALTDNQEIVMASQYRFGSEDFSLELPGGIVEPGETFLQAAQRELQEETGYTSTAWTYLGSVYSNPVMMNNRCHHFLAIHAQKTHSMQLDSTEDISIKLIDLDRMKRDIFDLVVHPHTLSALMRVMSFELNTEVQ